MQTSDQEFEQEYKYIRRDVKKVIITNAVIVVLLVAVYFADQKYGFLNQLENLF